MPTSPAWVCDHLTTEAIKRVGIFSPPAVGGLVRRCRGGLPTSSEENRVMVGILSTQVWYHQFVESALLAKPLPIDGASVLLQDRVGVYSPKSTYDPKPC